METPFHLDLRHGLETTYHGPKIGRKCRARSVISAKEAVAGPERKGRERARNPSWDGGDGECGLGGGRGVLGGWPSGFSPTGGGEIFLRGGPGPRG